MKQKITNQDLRNVFDYILEFKREHQGDSPTVRQVKEYFNLSSTSQAHKHLRLLESNGFIELGDNCSSIIILNAKFVLYAMPSVERKWDNLLAGGK